MREAISNQLANEEIIDMRLALGRCRRFLEERLLNKDLDAQEIAHTKRLTRQYNAIFRKVSMLSASIAVEVLERHEGRTEASEGLLQLSQSVTSQGCTREVLNTVIKDLVLQCKALKEF